MTAAFTPAVGLGNPHLQTLLLDLFVASRCLRHILRGSKHLMVTFSILHGPMFPAIIKERVKRKPSRHHCRL